MTCLKTSRNICFHLILVLLFTSSHAFVIDVKSTATTTKTPSLVVETARPTTTTTTASRLYLHPNQARDLEACANDLYCQQLLLHKGGEHKPLHRRASLLQWLRRKVRALHHHSPHAEHEDVVAAAHNNGDDHHRPNSPILTGATAHHHGSSAHRQQLLP